MNVDGQTTDYPSAVTTSRDFQTGEVAGLAGYGSRRFYRLDFWVGVGDATAVGFATTAADPLPVSLVHYGPISAIGLRDLKMSDLASPEAWMPRWDEPSAPDPDELRYRFLQARDRRDGIRRSRVTVTYPKNRPDVPNVQFRERLQGETADDFYKRVAIMYEACAAVTGGNITANIAKACSVPRNRAAQWVFQARKRGHLPPVERGKK